MEWSKCLIWTSLESMTNVHFSSLWNIINAAVIQNLRLHDVSKLSLFIGVIPALGFGPEPRAQSPWHQTWGSQVFTETSSVNWKQRLRKQQKPTSLHILSFTLTSKYQYILKPYFSQAKSNLTKYRKPKNKPTSAWDFAMALYAPGSASGDSRDNLYHLQIHNFSLKRKEYRERMVSKNTIQSPGGSNLAIISQKIK